MQRDAATEERREGGFLCSLDRFLKCDSSARMPEIQADSDPLFSPSFFFLSVFEFPAFLGGVETRQSLLWTPLQAGRKTTLSHFPLPQGKHTCVQHMRYRTPWPQMWANDPCSEKSYTSSQLSKEKLQLTRAMSYVCEMHPRNATPPYPPPSKLIV